MDIPQLPQGARSLRGLGAALELIPVPTVLTDGSGLLTTANTAWTRLTGLDRIESMGLGWMRLLHQDGKNQVLSAVRRSASGGAPIGVGTELLIEGVPVPACLFVRSGPLLSEPVIAVSVVTDMPDRALRAPRPAEHELIEEADAVIRELFAVGITLESCAENLAADQRIRLRRAVAQLDKVINRLRRAALDQVTSLSLLPGPAGHDTPDEHSSIERLLAEARRAVEMCEAESSCAANEVQVVDSVQSLRRAIVGLAEAVEEPGDGKRVKG